MGDLNGHRPAQLGQAVWFAQYWTRCRETERLLHYRLICERASTHDGARYENTAACYRYLHEAGNLARALGLVDRNEEGR
jgi:hypothetical protein